LRVSTLRTLAAATVLGATVLLSGWSGRSNAQPVAGAASELVFGAVGLIGTPYRYGGEDPASGLDCSGLVRYVARTGLGIQLPRQAEEIGRVGVAVDRQQLQPGDFVFFDTLGRPFSHVGVYLGDGQFVHSPARRGRVRVERMSEPYWQSRFSGARRLEALLLGEPVAGAAGAGAEAIAPAEAVDLVIRP
jgi:cell wall-associated NlpC family hydrolase